MLFLTQFHEQCEFEEQYEFFSEQIEHLEESDNKYIHDRVFGIISKLDDIDKDISDNTIGWSIDRMSKVDLTILRLAYYEMKYDRSLISMQGVGYKELFCYLDGKTSLEEAVEEIKKNTRHFAKRQMTWFRREKEVIFLAKNDFGYDDDKILDRILELTDWSIK